MILALAIVAILALFAAFALGFGVGLKRGCHLERKLWTSGKPATPETN